MKPRLTAVSLFSGIGGFDWGAYQAGVDIIWANDIDLQAATTYQALFPKVPFVQGDIKDVKEFPKADILIGCYPCTGFSLGARRRWHNNTTRDLRANDYNYLYREFRRALRDVKPQYLFVENVRGMASADDGWFLKQQMRGFREAGYKVWCEPLYAPNYGLAQARTRIFIVGVREQKGALNYSFPVPEYGQPESQPHRTLQDVIGGMPEWPEGEYFDMPFHGHYLTRNRKRGWHELSYTIVANAHHVPLHPMGKPMKYVGKDQWALQGRKNRRLSWRECAALQGLPSQMEFNGTLQDKYRMIGNAVPPPVGRALLLPIIDHEGRPN